MLDLVVMYGGLYMERSVEFSLFSSLFNDAHSVRVFHVRLCLRKKKNGATSERTTRGINRISSCS